MWSRSKKREKTYWLIWKAWPLIFKRFLEQTNLEQMYILFLKVVGIFWDLKKSIVQDYPYIVLASFLLNLFPNKNDFLKKFCWLNNRNLSSNKMIIFSTQKLQHKNLQSFFQSRWNLRMSFEPTVFSFILVLNYSGFLILHILTRPKIRFFP